MQFTAKLKRGTIWTLWRNHNRVGGHLGGVHFKWVPGGDFVTDTLTSDEVTRLRSHQDVTLEMWDHARTAAPELAVVPDVEPIPEPETVEQVPESEEPTEENTAPDNVPAYVRRAQRAKR
jgi:hypothetical protein